MTSSIKPSSNTPVDQSHRNLNKVDKLKKKYSLGFKIILSLGALAVIGGSVGVLISGNLLFLIPIGIGILVSGVVAIVYGCKVRFLKSGERKILDEKQREAPLSDPNISPHGDLSLSSDESSEKSFHTAREEHSVSEPFIGDSPIFPPSSSVVINEEQEELSQEAVRQYFKSCANILVAKNGEGIKRFYLGGKSYTERVFLFLGKGTVEKPITDMSRISSSAIVTSLEQQIKRSFGKKEEKRTVNYGEVSSVDWKSSKDYSRQGGHPWSKLIQVRNPDPQTQSLAEALEISVKGFKGIFEQARNNNIEYCQFEIFGDLPADLEKRGLWKTMREWAFLRACTEWIEELGEVPGGLILAAVDRESMPFEDCFD